MRKVSQQRTTSACLWQWPGWRWRRPASPVPLEQSCKQMLLTHGDGNPGEWSGAGAAPLARAERVVVDRSRQVVRVGREGKAVWACKRSERGMYKQGQLGEQQALILLHCRRHRCVGVQLHRSGRRIMVGAGRGIRVVSGIDRHPLRTRPPVGAKGPALCFLKEGRERERREGRLQHCGWPGIRVVAAGRQAHRAPGGGTGRLAEEAGRLHQPRRTLARQHTPAVRHPQPPAISASNPRCRVCCRRGRLCFERHWPPNLGSPPCLGSCSSGRD